ncbi:hypothetical protein L873DRAFT_951372 [Choiromyces venosus 120613-1]|uniref:Uncharacterized protein n=1 Tax=Choiromyces venosus 120613-1 TaxID=1336337 RepID=A0A3N4K3M3_9PEZI|nr:hypothetical protein L873DRAFT_951372 [Choiromyces venosus 120613-1]
MIRRSPASVWGGCCGAVSRGGFVRVAVDSAVLCWGVGHVGGGGGGGGGDKGLNASFLCSLILHFTFQS